MDLSGFDKPGFTGNTNAVKSAPKPQQAKSLGGVKGFLVNSLPAIGGGLGAVAGIPGDLLSAGGASVAGGTVGAGAGEALKQRILGQSISPKQVAIQAAEGGVASGIGSAVKGGQTAAKSLANLGLKGAQDVPETANVVEKAASTAPKPTIGQKISNTLVNKGEQTEAKLGAYAPGQKINGVQLNTAASQKISDTLSNEGINALSAPERLSQVGQKLNQYNTARNSLLEAHNAPLEEEDKTALQQDITNRLKNEAGGTADNVQKHAATFTQEALGKNDVADLGKYKTSLDNNAINWSRNPASVEPGQMIAAKAVRGAIKDFVEQKVPGIAEVNQKSTGLRTAEGALMNSSSRLANLTTGAEGLWGRLLSGETAEKAKAIVAKGAQATGKALGGEAERIAPAAKSVANEAQDVVKSPSSVLGSLAGTAQNISTLPVRAVATAVASPVKSAGSIGKQLLLRGAGNLVANPPNTNQTTQPGQDLSSLASSADQSAQDANTDQSQYPQENMLYDIERDPTHASTYEALYKVLNPSSTPTAAAQNAVLAAEDTQSQLNAYKGALGTAGGSKGGILGTITKLAGESKLVNTPQAGSAATVNQARNDLGAQLAKLVTGGSRPPEAVTQHYTDLIPTTTDTPAAAQAKFSYIESLVNDMKSNAQGSSNSSNSVDLSGLAADLGQ